MKHYEIQNRSQKNSHPCVPLKGNFMKFYLKSETSFHF